jgi:hypothetical protein
VECAPRPHRTTVFFRPMANASTLHEYARIGATARIMELKAEIAELQRIFPDLGDVATARKSPGRSKTVASPALAKLMDPVPKRRRRKLSAAARKAISDAQKRRWAALKAKK